MSATNLCLFSRFKFSAGTCWVKRQDSGRCKQPIAQNITRAECCEAGIDVGYTDGDSNQFGFLLSIAMGRGNCQSCIGKWALLQISYTENTLISCAPNEPTFYFFLIFHFILHCSYIRFM